MQLMQALGGPRPEALLPMARDPQWAQARSALEGELRALNIAARIRTPQALWAIVHKGRRTPRGATWSTLAGTSTLGDLIERIGGRDTEGELVITT